MRRRVDQDARADRAGVAHVDQRHRQVLGEGQHHPAVGLDRGRLVQHVLHSMAAWPRPTTDSESALARGRLPPTRTRYWTPALSAASSTLFCCSAMLGLCPVTTNTL